LVGKEDKDNMCCFSLRGGPGEDVGMGAGVITFLGEEFL
jgi:hypothetical protein